MVKETTSFEESKLKKAIGETETEKTQRENLEKLGIARSNFVSGGGGGSDPKTPTPGGTSQSEREAQALEKAEELRERAEQETRFTEQRRLEFLASRQEAIARSEREGTSLDIASSRTRSEEAKELRDKATRQKRDISSEVRERQFIQEQAKREQQQDESIVSMTDAPDMDLESGTAEFGNVETSTGGGFTGKIKDFFIGESGKQFVGVNLPKPLGTNLDARADITSQKISGTLKTKGGFAGEVVSELIPTTPAGVLVTAGSVALFPVLPKAIRIVGSVGISGLGTKGALDTSLTPAQRTASGLIGVAGGVGAVSESAGLIRGVRAQTLGRVKGEFKPIRIQEEGFKAIEFPKQTERIGLILEGSPARTGATANINLPKTSPLKRGGFEVKQSEKAQFLGKDQDLTTSQIGLFKEGKSIPIEREFFVTPQEPTLKIAETRVSRLGINDLITPSKNAEIGFGLPPPAQIGIIRKGAVGVKETPTQFKIGSGTELEAIKSTGTITDVRKVGVTTVRGEGVDIFEFKVGKGKDIKVSTDARVGDSTKVTSRVSGEGTISLATSSSRLFSTSPTISTSPRVSTTSITSTSPRVSKSVSTPSITSTPTRISTPPSTSTSPRVSSPISIPSSSNLPSTSGLSSTSRISTPRRTPTPRRVMFRTTPPIKQRAGTFGVSVKRGGIFRSVGKGLSLNQAINVGATKTRTTLSASFRITPEKKGKQAGSLRLPKGFRRSRSKKGKGDPFLFIEKKSGRLSTPTELSSIKMARIKI